jgi:hypothetical protein
MIMSSRVLKKAPLPWSVIREPTEPKLHQVIRARFIEMFGLRTNLSTSERKRWGAFLAGHGIYWHVKVSIKRNWEGWEFVHMDGFLAARPKGLEEHARVLQYYVPQDLALKMLVLGTMPCQAQE